MITYEELFITLLYFVCLYIVLRMIYKIIKENHQLKHKNLSISKIEKDIKNKIVKINKKHKIKK